MSDSTNAPKPCQCCDDLLLLKAAQARAIAQAVGAATAELRAAFEKERQDWAALCLDWTAALDEAEAQLAALRAALARYGRHDYQCAWDRDQARSFGRELACTCGYSAALEGK